MDAVVGDILGSALICRVSAQQPACGQYPPQRQSQNQSGKEISVG
jgi:hypothetical protein